MDAVGLVAVDYRICCWLPTERVRLLLCLSLSFLIADDRKPSATVRNSETEGLIATTRNVFKKGKRNV